ncbi:MAG: asparagine synthase B [Bacillota bacterium]
MCGICGYYGKKSDARKLPLSGILHRGPDGTGERAGKNFIFGHTRLAIIDVDKGSQPMCNEDDSICITFNGEIYNYKTLRDKLKRCHIFKTDCDTEVILHLYEEEGPAGLKKLDGMFALAIAAPDSFVLARDPVGIKPLYTVEDRDGVHFASEIKVFVKKREKIREFPPGHISAAGEKSLGYYSLPLSYQANMSWNECLPELRKRLQKSVEKRLMSDVPLGSFLSGGLDSSLISALIREQREELHTFSVAVGNSADRRYALMAAEHLGTIHHEYVLSPEEIWSAVPEVIYYLESYDQSLVRSAVANYFLAKMAAREVKVVLTGEGADELFAGYAYLDSFTDWNELHEELRCITGRLHNTNLQRVDRMTMAHGLEARVPFLDKGMIEWALAIPPWYKRSETGIRKWCLREAYRDWGFLPEEIIFREKEKFAEGSGVAPVLSAMASEKAPEKDYRRELAAGAALKSREEYYYYKVFCDYFGRDIALSLVGHSRS